MGEQIKKQIKGLMSDPRWEGLEAFLRDFKNRQFVQNSIKRAIEFDTIWYAAEAEGGKRYLELFFAELERMANEASDKEL